MITYYWINFQQHKNWYDFYNESIADFLFGSTGICTFCFGDKNSGVFRIKKTINKQKLLRLGILGLVDKCIRWKMF